MQPVLFLAHGSPFLAQDQGVYGQDLRALGATLSPEAVLVVSAHWESEGRARVGSSVKPDLLYDFSGFPPDLYHLRYPAVGDAAWAKRIRAALRDVGPGVQLDSQRGLDHGAWVPLRHLFPEAQIPVLQLSLPRPRTPKLLTTFGKALASLRSEGLLIVGSGGLVHNLRRLGPANALPESWAYQFDAWMAGRLTQGDVEGAMAWEGGPNARTAHPTTEHLDPLFVCLGAAGGCLGRTVHEGWEFGNLSLRCLAWD